MVGELNASWQEGRLFAPLSGHIQRAFGPLPLLIIPIGILGYYFVFSYTIYVVSLLVLLALTATLSGGIGTPWLATAPLFAIYGWWWITSLWSPNPDATFYLAVSGAYVLYGVYAYPMAVRFGDLFSLRLMMLCALAFACAAGISYMQIGSFIDLEKGSMRSLFAAIFLAGFPACVLLGVTRKSLLAWFTLLATAFIGFQLGSRTFLLLSLPALLATLFVVGRNWQLLRLARLPLVLLAVTAGLLVLTEAAASMGSELFTSIGRGTSFQIDEAVFAEAQSPGLAENDLERRLLLVVGMESFENNPLFGAGFLSTPYYMGFYYYSALGAHGLPLFLLGETGLLGTALFLVMAGMAIAGYFKYARLLSADGASIVYTELITLGVVMGNGMFHQVYQDFYFFLFIGLGLYRFRLYSLYRKAAASQSSDGDLHREPSTRARLELS